MCSNYNSSFENYCDKLADFDESTLIAPNIFGIKQEGNISEVRVEISDKFTEFCKENSIGKKYLFLAATSLALNKYNFSDKNLIYFAPDKTPVVLEFENRSISIRQYLKDIIEIYDFFLESNLIEQSDLEPEFYFSYNGDINLSDNSYSNYLNIREHDELISLSLLFNDQLYTKDYLNVFLDSIKIIVNQIIGLDIDKNCIADICLEEEKEISFSEIELPYLHKRFEKQVDKSPEKIALVASDGVFSYDELNQKANRIANALIKNGVSQGNNVLVMLKRNSNLIASILGILKAGCAFIPIDLEYPQDRIDYIYENSQADYIIANKSGDNTLDVDELLAEGDVGNPDVEMSCEDTAYMIYTSGSTGKPKGVIISHKNICNEVKNPKSEYESLLCVATIAFDASLEDVFTSLANGLKLILASDSQIKNIPELIDLLNETKPEVAEMTSSRLASYLEVDAFCEAVKCLKCLSLGGEQFSAKVFTDFRKYNPDAAVYNGYGPTETTITSNFKQITDINNITVGPPLENYITDVRDIDGKLVPQGVMGELYIGGMGVGKGYYNMPDKTEEVFITINDIPYYKSGDYAIETPDGEIDIKGRIDNQIKLRGLRIEIGEIESNIYQYPGIKKNVVVIKEINNNEHLCAYYTADNEIDDADLKEYLKDRLTRYMVPTVFMQLDVMPETPNGKTDLKQLPEPELILSNTLPETDTEVQLMDMVSSMTQTKEFGTTDELYALGFTSLTLMKLNARIFEEIGVNLNIVDILDNPTIKNIAVQIENIESDNFDIDEIIEESKDRIYYPLPANPLGAYYECIMNPKEARYNLPAIARFDSDVDAERLKDSIIKTINTYPYLKARLVSRDGKIMLKRDDSIAIDEIPIVEVDEITDEEIEKENVKSFNLINNQLFRFKIYKTPSQTILFSDIHHIISDGESLDVLFNCIAKAYDGLEIPNEIINGYVYSLIDDKNKKSEHYKRSKEYFHNKLSNDIEPTVLTPDLNGNQQDGVLKSVYKTIDRDLVNDLCGSEKISPNALILACTVLALEKYTFSDKTLLTTIFNGRFDPIYFNTQGFLVKTLPLVFINENRNLTVAQFLNQVSNNWKESINYCDYTFMELTGDFNITLDFFYAFHNVDSENIEINNKKYNIKFLENLETDYKIAFLIYETKKNIKFKILYNDHLYSQKYVETFIDSILNTLNQFIGNDIEKLMIKDIELGKNKELPVFTPVDIPFLHKRFEHHAKSKPDDIALVAVDKTLTYNQLNEKANRIANGLIKNGVMPGSNILVILNRNSDLIVSIMGILKAGCAFIPIDPDYPQDRIDYIYENSQADYIISNKSSENTLDVCELLAESDVGNPEVEMSPEDTAYMIYTSGSTGKPKGVMISHKNICNQVQNPKSQYKSLLCLATIAFDVSVDDILTSLSNGLKLVLASDIQIKNIPELIDLLNETKPEVSEITPSRLASYLEVSDFCKAVKCLKCLFLGGEQFSARVFEDFRKYNSSAVVYNSYGPTETTITSNNKEINSVDDLTVGYPLENYVTDVRDIDGKLVPQGVMGELYIGGMGVGKGYYNMPDKTREVFLTINDVPYYKSGDYAIETPNGEIDIKGRIDNQIKLRGLRIEIGEIESNINKYPGIKQNVVVVKEINNNEHLCAYYIADNEIDGTDLKKYLKERLTRYMVPTIFMQLDEMPKTPNGKIDLKHLPKPELNLSNTLPETDTEVQLMDLASSMSPTKEFGTTDDLYAVGFTSLTLMRLNSKTFEKIGVNFNIVDVLDNPTIKNIAAQIENIKRDTFDIDIVEKSKDRVYYPLTSNQLGVYYECIQSQKEAHYNIPIIIRFDNDVNADKLKDSIIKTINVYPYLKTRLILRDGQVMQKRDDSIPIDEIPIVEVDEITDDEIEKENVKSFNLEDSQLFRFKIYKTSSQTILFADLHHLITDGESFDALFDSIAKTYDGLEIPKEIIDGYAVSVIEEENKKSDHYNLSKQYFHDKLSNGVESTILPPDLNGNQDDGVLKAISKTIDFDLINDLCYSEKISPNALILSSTVLALNKYAFTNKVLLTTIFNGRLNPNYSNTQGFLVKTLPLVFVNENRSLTVSKFLNQVSTTWKESIAHCDYPYIDIAQDFNLKPEFFYAFHNLDSENIEINNKEYVGNYLDTLETDYKLTFDVYDTDEGIVLYVQYNDQLYSKKYVETFLDSVLTILNQFVSNDMGKLMIKDIELEPSSQLPSFRPVETPFLHKRFEQQAESKPDDIALVAADETLTYEQLNEKANRVANALIDKGVEPRSNVLVMLKRDSNLISAILGILKAGCAFVPIDLEYPQDRIDYIYENSRADYIISDESAGNVLNINELIKEENTNNPDVEISSDDVAYMIYTSGSTGKPKGIMTSHMNITNLFSKQDGNLMFDIYSKMDKVLALSTVSFDAFLLDFMGLTFGLTLVFANDDEVKNIDMLAQLMHRQKPDSIAFTTPSRALQYLENDDFRKEFLSIKRMGVGGEMLPKEFIYNLLENYDVELYNIYGPTETTVTCNTTKITDADNINVGKALYNYITEIRDLDGNLLPKGVMGELYIGGYGVAGGYYGLDDKTREVFIKINDIPYYRSGDYAIELPNGEITIKGRIDNQIKLRGLRIEIGEIESNIGKYPGIKQNVVVVKEINNTEHLCSYFTADDEIDIDLLKDYLKNKLTKYMIPTVFMQLDEMPQTPNGKLDLKQLPKPKLVLEMVAPENKIEEKLFEITSDLIGSENFGTTDDLYALGFTSLTLMKLNSIIYNELDANLDISILFNSPTIKKLAIEIRNSGDDEYINDLIESSKDRQYYPLTENQLGVYYECMQSPDEIKYTMPTTIRFDKDISAIKLKDAIIETIESHPYLKTRILFDGGTLKQKRDDDIPIDEINIVKVSHISDEEIIKNDVKAFTLDNSQLFRFKIYDTDDDIVLFSDFHHIITDGESQNNLFAEIASVYNGEEFDKEIINGYIYSLIEENLVNSDEYIHSKEFFQDRLSQEFDSTVLTPNLNGNPDEGVPKYLHENLDVDVIKKFCEDNSISQNVLFMSAIVLSLNKFTFSDKTLITSIFNGRSNPNYYRTQGFLVKTIPLIFSNENRNVTVKEFIQEIDKVWKDTINHSSYPYTKIAEEFKLKPEVFYNYTEFLESEDILFGNKYYESNDLGDDEVTITDSKIIFTVKNDFNGISLDIEYNDQLYSENYVQLFMDSIKHILNKFMTNDIEELKIKDIALVESNEIPEFKPIENPFLHKRFEKQVESKPDEIALVAVDKTLTYRQLNEKANRIANALIKRGIEPRSNVLVMLERDSNLISAILGVLKAGCSFVPIDLEYPQDRIDYIYENSQADYIICDESTENTLDIKELLMEDNVKNPDVSLNPDDLAYMIYTSGSTGKPKGVMISHKNISNLFVENEDNLIFNMYNNINKVLSIISTSFDPFLVDLSSLTLGLKLIFASDKDTKNIGGLTDLIKMEKPDTVALTPSRLMQYLEHDEFKKQLLNFKFLCSGGEMMPKELVSQISAIDELALYNMYGPTETTVASNASNVIESDKITVGKPLFNYITDVRDIDGKLLPQGVMGELYIGGEGVGKGYYNKPDKTKEVFLEINNIPYYRTGDLAIELPNGEIDIKGRIDSQIKLRGLRIEIGEIESNISKYPGIKQNVVVIKEINNAEHLCSYFTAEDEIDINLLKHYLRNKLTKYMVPTVFMQIDEMPQTPNGKLDLKQLPKPKLVLEMVAPKNEIEEKLFEIISDLIGSENFGTTDDLYALGFTSLILMKLNSLIYTEMGVNIDISVLFNDPTIQKLASEIKDNDNDHYLEKFIRLADELDYFPLTENQLGIYYECMQNPDETKYTMPTVLRFGSDVNANRLKQAVIQTVDAHPYLKTRIITTDDGLIKQRRYADCKIDEIEIVEVDSISDEEILKNDVKAFAFGDEQLFKFKIYETADETVLFSDFHHIITDGVSQNNLFADIANAYENRRLSREIIDGYIYSLIEEDTKNSEKYEKSKEFFDEKLSQEIESTILTPNLNGNPDDGKQKTVLDSIDSYEIKELCNKYSLSQNALILSALTLTLNKYTFTDKTLITTIFNGRSSSYYYDTQGFLVKTLPLIFNNENRKETIKNFIKGIDEVWKDTLSHSEYPYTNLAEDYQLKPEFFFSYQEFLDGEGIVINDKTYENYELDDEGLLATAYKINFDLNSYDDYLEFEISYNDQLYSEDYIKTFINSMKFVLEQFASNNIEKQRICDIELETLKELPEFTPVETPIIHKRFEKQVEANPNNIALVATDVTLTASELNQKANRIANALIKKGVEPRNNVLLMLPRNSDLIASILGILKAGCAYIPIDLEYPLERIKYIYENSQADYIISNETYDNSLDIKELLAEENISNPDVEISPNDTAYMIYTSGSTGNPKGVMISHENVCNQVEGNPKAEYDNLLSIATVAFDTSLEDIITGITNGIKIIFANDSEIKNVVDLIQLIKREKPQVMEFTPSRLLSYLEVDEFCEAINCAQCIVMGGEQFSAKAFNEVKEYTDAKVYNSYGPTEATIASNYKEITDTGNITIGKALQNYVTEVRDIDGKLLPQGVMGELYIGGVGVGKGYYNMPDKTEEAYLIINNIPYYRSGDYAVELSNGELDIKGRIDNQIKLRGLRIEIGEIETNIARFPNIKSTVVAVKKINNSDHLCAYFTAEKNIDVKLLKRYLQNKLTKYMVPTLFMQIDEMPQTPNGKTDIKALPEPSLALEFIEPETETEKKIFKLVSSLSNAEEFGITDDLYALGFTSLTLMKLNSMIYNETDVNIEITDLFNNPTIQSLADKIDNNIDVQIDIPEIIKTAETMDLFPLTSNQMGIYYECMQTEEIKYTMPSTIRFSSDVDAYKLKRAIIDTVEAHPYLKTRIISTPEGELRQKRCDDAEIDEIEIVEVDSISNKEMMDNDVRYIPLEDNQLFRFKIYKTPDETVLFSDIHHIITDGVSQDLLFKDMLTAYSGEGEFNEELVDGFAYSLIEAELSGNEISKEYYKNKFAQGFESTVLTPNLNGNPDEGKIKLIEDRINSNFVRMFCQDHSISPNVLFMSATILALNKFTFSDKALITTIFNGRSNSNYYNTQGMLVKTLPIMVDSENRSMMVEDFIKMVDKSWKDALVHSNYPYTSLSEEYQLKPEFFYSYNGAFETDSLEMDGNNYAMEELDGTVATDYKINMDIYDEGEDIGIYIEYNDQIYTEDYAIEFLNAIKYTLVQFFVNDMDKLRIEDIELATNAMLPEFEEVVNPFLHRRFEAQVDKKPDEIALVATDEILSFDELNKKANRIANALIKKGVKPRSNILIMLPRNSDLIASIIGVLKAGCAFIPLDLKFPKERIDYIYENSQADYIINVDGLELNSLSIKELLEESNTNNTDIELTPDDLAYLIYTSGSTGNPKGVMISHENACNQTEANPKCEYNNLLSIATIAFDTSLEDILTGITNGMKIIFANDDEIKSIVELIRLIKREKPEVMEFTPSRLLSYLEFEEFCDAIECAKCIVMGGEQFSAQAFNGVKKYCDATVYNSYGPTEATIASNYKEITDSENITIGKALRNYITDVRDIDGKLLPQGVMGELYIGGVGVGKGYYNMPDKTEVVFRTIGGISYYKSGDYAIALPDGDIDIKGRIDNQIKLRGLRIEIGEIESNINRYPSVKQTVVVIKQINNNDHLCAYFTADEKIDKDALKAYLSERLTQYMVPTVFMQIDEMPQTPNGKTDAKALPEPKLELTYVSPKNKLEQTICEIYSSILDMEIVGAEDNFFEIGGTSLIASKLIIELLKQDYDVKYDDIFKNQTPRKLAGFLSGDESSEDLDVDIIENYDYTTIHSLLDKNTLENFAKGENLELGNVLLTGVTGFMGVHILYEYIKNEEGTIYCMLRKGQFDTCEERFVDLMNYYFDEDFSDIIGSRIILSEGDITNPEDFKKLEDCPIDTIINCAAIVKHYTHDDYIFKVNVDGVINGLEFAEVNDINYVQISTTSVLDQYSEDMDISNISCDERTLYWGQDLSNKYLNSKFLAERMVLEKALSGVNVKIIRVGNLMSRYSDGVFQKNYDTNAFLNNIKAITNLKATVPLISNNIVDLSPIDYVAKATLALAKTPKESVVFHVVSDKSIPIGDLIDALNSFGFGIEEVTPDEFREIYKQNMDENIQGIITADLTIDDFDDEEYTQDDMGEIVMMNQSLEILESFGFNWPECNREYLIKLIKYLIKVNYFNLMGE